MHVHKYLSNLLHNVYAFSSFPVRKQITLALFRNRKDNIVSTFLLFGSPFPSPFKVRSKFGRFLFPFHPQPFLPGPLGNLKQPMVNQLGLAPSSFVCWSIKPFHWSINQSNQDSDSPVAKRVPWSLKFRHYCKSHLPLGLIRNAEFHKGFYFRCKMSDSDVKSTRPFKQRKSFGKPICLVFCLHAALLMFCCSPCDANLNRPAIFFNFSQSERWSCWNPSQVPVKNSCE